MIRHKDNTKSMKYIKMRTYSDYDIRWMSGKIQNYMNFYLKNPNQRAYTNKKSLIKYYHIEYENN